MSESPRDEGGYDEGNSEPVAEYGPKGELSLEEELRGLVSRRGVICFGGQKGEELSIAVEVDLGFYVRVAGELEESAERNSRQIESAEDLEINEESYLFSVRLEDTGMGERLVDDSKEEYWLDERGYSALLYESLSNRRWRIR